VAENILSAKHVKSRGGDPRAKPDQREETLFQFFTGGKCSIIAKISFYKEKNRAKGGIIKKRRKSRHGERRQMKFPKQGTNGLPPARSRTAKKKEGEGVSKENVNGK